MLRDEREAYERKDQESRALAEQLDAFKEANDRKGEELRNLAEQMEEMNQMMEEQQKLLEDQHSKLKEQENVINDREIRTKELEKMLEDNKEELANKEEYDKALKGKRFVLYTPIKITASILDTFALELQRGQATMKTCAYSRNMMGLVEVSVIVVDEWEQNPTVEGERSNSFYGGRGVWISH